MKRIKNKKGLPWSIKDHDQIRVPKNVIQTGVYRNLMNQMIRIARHNRQGSKLTKVRYYQAMERFIRFVADVFRLEKMSNMHGKHLASYILHMQENEKAPSTIKAELSAIRFWHDHIDNPRFILPDNDDLETDYGVELEGRTRGDDRAWSEGEVHRMVKRARLLGQDQIANMIRLMKLQGLRIHEVIRLDRATAEKALRTGLLTVKGKGGLIRTIPLLPAAREILELAILNVKRGQKLFVHEEEESHDVIEMVQRFISAHRDELKDPDNHVPLTAHGLRYMYAQREYFERMDDGVNDRQAKKEVSLQLGHRREDVTNIYLPRENSTDDKKTE